MKKQKQFQSYPSSINHQSFTETTTVMNMEMKMIFPTILIDNSFSNSTVATKICVLSFLFPGALWGGFHKATTNYRIEGEKIVRVSGLTRTERSKSLEFHMIIYEIIMKYAGTDCDYGMEGTGNQFQ